ncbi:putative Adenosine deaminase domain-containing protein [Seiridium cardinale]|uniref:Adenosine deaminase domain-containing protein n=1 Tax=Seiridium cardinale TaxID=138064 RepID=A0ABR2Y566_9PEZI
MGTSCSKPDKELYPDHGHEKDLDGSPTKLHKKFIAQYRAVKMDGHRPKESLVIGRYDRHRSTKLDDLDPHKPLEYERQISDAGALQESIPVPEELEPKYFSDRAEIERRGRQLAFDYILTQNASPAERKAKELLEIIKRNDDIAIYSAAEPLQGYRGQKHRRFAGDHFLTNWDLLYQTVLFKVAQELPKGAHLHIHFNSTLLPHALLDIAIEMEQMYISSDKPLTKAGNFDTCEIQFLMKSEDVVAADREKLRNIKSQEQPTQSRPESYNLFSKAFAQVVDKKNQRLAWMKYRDFREQWDQVSEKKRAPQKASIPGLDSSADDLLDLAVFDMTWKEWLISKLVFDDQEAHNSLQTSEGAWEKFNGRTRMMKGLFNYETAFVKYTWNCLEEFDRDKIQYAEIRPNFMMTNQIYTDNGSKQLDNTETMRKIVETFKAYKKQTPSTNICGLKVIYCTPRSFPADKVKASLDECLAFKTGEFRDYIAGFDLVGEEAQGKPLKAFVPQFLEFKRKCREHNVDIPFLFHCGETLEIGGDTDGNLFDALLLDSKRIGHGFALARKPYLIAEFKKRNICLELCPISNQVLGLTPRMNGHAMYDLLANDVHCTVNSDNGTLFKSTLSHDFYEVMVGSKAMNLHGWRQLIEWSISHASLDSHEREKLRNTWEPLWNAFIDWVNEQFKDVQLIVDRPTKPTGAMEGNEDPESWKRRVGSENARYRADEAEFHDQVKKWQARGAGR